MVPVRGGGGDLRFGVAFDTTLDFPWPFKAHPDCQSFKAGELPRSTVLTWRPAASGGGCSSPCSGCSTLLRRWSLRQTRCGPGADRRGDCARPRTEASQASITASPARTR